MKGWKTVITNASMVLIGLAAMFGIIIPAEVVNDASGALIALVGAINVVLRAFTDTPIGKSS